MLSQFLIDMKRLRIISAGVGQHLRLIDDDLVAAENVAFTDIFEVGRQLST